MLDPLLNFWDTTLVRWYWTFLSQSLSFWTIILPDRAYKGDETVTIVTGNLHFWDNPSGSSGGKLW